MTYYFEQIILFVKSVLLYSCDNLDTVDLASYSQYVYCTGGNLSVTSGLDQMLYKLKENIPDDKIFLKRMVCNVNWSCNEYHNKVINLL